MTCLHHASTHMMQAYHTPFLPLQAFPSYSSLAQHLSSKHAGINSEDVKYLQLRGLLRVEESSSHTNAGSSLADLFAGPSLQEAAASPKATQPSRSTVSAATPAAAHKRAGLSSAWALSSPLAAQLKHHPSSSSKASSSKAMTISLGSMQRAAPSTPARASTLGKGKAAAAGRGAALMQQQQVGGKLVPRHGKLRREGAPAKKPRLSHVKRLVLEVRVCGCGCESMRVRARVFGV